MTVVFVARLAALFPLERGLAFFEEGLAGFLGVFARERDADVGEFVAELLLHVGILQALDHAALEEPQRDRAPFAELRAVFGSAGEELVVVDDLARHAERD